MILMKSITLTLVFCLIIKSNAGLLDLDETPNENVPSTPLNNLCPTEYCNNNGVCKFSDNEAVCFCNSGYTGSQCDKVDTVSVKKVNPLESTLCSPTFCGPNGNCVIKNNVATCICKPGFAGSKCQAVDPCSRKPCGSGGACFPVVTNQNMPSINEQVTFHCQCYAGYTGQRCQHAPSKPCTSNPCLNHGICVNMNNSYDYHCICVGTYTGKDCGTYLDQCANNKCKNEALCIPSTVNNNYTCSCKNGFYGELCEKEYNECHVIVNGLITSPCFNNATCYDLVDAYYCECNGPWIGKNCETSLLKPGKNLNNALLPVASVAALLPIIPAAVLLLRSNLNKATTTAFPIPTTTQVQSPCKPNPCPSGTQCVENGSSFNCKCPDGSFGPNCLPNPCSSNPCKPGSTCIPINSNVITGCNISAYICVCSINGSQQASLLC